MKILIESPDSRVLDLLRANGPMTISQLATAKRVTATAVRQRLTRLMMQGLVQREVFRHGRGRPSHRYALTEKARRQVGDNFGDLAILLWNELRSVRDPEVRRGMLQRLASGMAEMYKSEVNGPSLEERLEALRQLFARRRVPIEVQADSNSGGPSLTVVDCPYPELAERDRGVCAMERMLFAELLESPLKLTQCRLDGHNCCQFETN